MVSLVIICSLLITGQFASALPVNTTVSNEAPNAFLITLAKSCNISQLLLKQKEILENCKNFTHPNPSLNNNQDILCWLYSYPLQAYCTSKPKELELPTLVEVQNKNYGIDAVCGSIVNHTQPQIHIKRMQCNILCSDVEHDVLRPECLLSYYYFSLLKLPTVPPVQGASVDSVQIPPQPSAIDPKKMLPDKKIVNSGSAPGEQIKPPKNNKIEIKGQGNSPQSELKKDQPPPEVKEGDIPLASGNHEEHPSGSEPGKEVDASHPETPSKSGGAPPKDSKTHPNPQEASNDVDQQNQEEENNVQKVETQKKPEDRGEPGQQNLDVPPKAGSEQKPDAVKPDVVKPDVVKPDVVKPDEVKPDEVKPDKVKPDVEFEEDEQHANDYVQTEDLENNPGDIPQLPKQEEHKTVEKKPDTLGEDPVNSDNISEIDDESYFMSYFMVICVLVVLGYVGYHNRIKVMALLLEGKRGKRQHRARRPNSANYHKLDSNLEEAISSNVTKNSNNVIY